MTIYIHCLWDDDIDQWEKNKDELGPDFPDQYNFNTEAQAVAFMSGLHAGARMTDLAILIDGEIVIRGDVQSAVNAWFQRLEETVAVP